MLHVDIPTRAQVDKLAGYRGGPAVSIYLRTPPLTQDIKADRIELKNLLSITLRSTNLKRSRYLDQRVGVAKAAGLCHKSDRRSFDLKNSNGNSRRKLLEQLGLCNVERLKNRQRSVSAGHHDGIDLKVADKPGGVLTEGCGDFPGYLPGEFQGGRWPQDHERCAGVAPNVNPETIGDVMFVAGKLHRNFLGAFFKKPDDLFCARGRA